MKSMEVKNTFLHSSREISTQKNLLVEKFGFLAFALASLIVLLILGTTLWFVFAQGGKYIFSWDYLLTPPQGSRSDAGGILYPLVITLYLIVSSIALAAPLGIFAAIYLNHYANPQAWWTQLARFAIESLAGIPSVIYGLFGLAFFSSFLGFNRSVLAGSLTVAIMILPLIIRTGEEALSSIPQSYWDASFALGASKVQTLFKVILPAAFNGIFTGIMLSIGRVIAESAILFLVAGGSISSAPRLFGSQFPFVLPDSGRALAVHLYIQAESYDNPEKAFGTASILIVLIIILNLVAFIFSPKSSNINMIMKTIRRQT